jgi:hypothetical protein
VDVHARLRERRAQAGVPVLARQDVREAVAPLLDGVIDAEQADVHAVLAR